MKWGFQPAKRSKSWRITIREQRQEITLLLKENPSLKPDPNEAIVAGYASGIDLVVQETDLDDQDLPAVCPYTPEKILNPSFPATLTPARP